MKTTEDYSNKITMLHETSGRTIIELKAFAMTVTELLKEYANQSKWISVKDELPEENETVWACNISKGWVWLACIVYENDCGWLWAVSNSLGCIYSEDRKIIAECEYDDEYDITHWVKLPLLPEPPKL